MGSARAYSACRRFSWHLAMMVAAMVMASLACGDKDPVKQLMAELEEAAEARDVDGIEQRLASGFTGNEEMSRVETLSLLQRYFAGYEKISLDVTNVERGKDRVNFRVAFSGQANQAFGLQNLLPSTAACVFELRFVSEGGTLKVKKAVWQEVPAF